MKDKKPKVIVIGAAIIDILVRPADEEVFRTGSFPADEIIMSPGADALNETVVLAALGIKVRLETIIGNDRAGKFILEYCREKKIELPEDCTREKISTGINIVLIDRTGERHFITNPSGTLRGLTSADIHMPFDPDAAIICFASIFVFPEIKAEDLEIIFRQAKKQGKIVCADMTKCKNSEKIADIECALRYVDYLFPNAEEAMLLTETDTVEKAAESLMAAGVKHVAVKCGRQGCYLKSLQETRWIPAVGNTRCVDTTGAGDSFAAGFVYALSKNKNFLECAEFANKCGARAVERTGAVAWTEDI